MPDANDHIVASYKLQDIDKARACRDKLLSEGREAYLTREFGEGRYSGLVNVHVRGSAST